MANYSLWKKYRSRPLTGASTITNNYALGISGSTLADVRAKLQERKAVRIERKRERKVRKQQEIATRTFLMLHEVAHKYYGKD